MGFYSWLCLPLPVFWCFGVVGTYLNGVSCVTEHRWSWACGLNTTTKIVTGRLEAGMHTWQRWKGNNVRMKCWRVVGMGASRAMPSHRGCHPPPGSALTTLIQTKFKRELRGPKWRRVNSRWTRVRCAQLSQTGGASAVHTVHEESNCSNCLYTAVNRTMRVRKIPLQIQTNNCVIQQQQQKQRLFEEGYFSVPWIYSLEIGVVHI